MNADSAIEWLVTENFNQWRLFRGENGEKVSEFEESESQDEAVRRLKNILMLQSPGKYQLKGWRGKGRHASQSVFRLEIKQPTAAQSNFSGSQNFDVKEIFEKAKEAALQEMQQRAWKEMVETRLAGLEKGLEDLRKSVLEFNDDDDDNNDDAFERITQVAGQIPKFTNGLQSLNGLLKTQ